MKKLNIIEQQKENTEIGDFNYLEQKFDILFPEKLKQFVLVYEGAFVRDTYYLGEPTFKEVLYLRKHPDFASIEAILEGHKYYGVENFIPFAIDSGGWDYNVSINKDTYGQIWVNKFDNGEEDTMEYVAPSLEEFINGLTAEE